MPEWTTLHDVTFLYLFLAENADHHLSASERSTIVRRLTRWAPGETPSYVTRVLREAHDAVNTGTSARTAGEIIDSLKKAPLSRSQRREILGDLEQIARADGDVVDGEHDFLRNLAQVWGIEPSA